MSTIKKPKKQNNQTAQNISLQDDSIQKELQTFLQQVISQPPIHAKWLNTLSFLEHIGSRKIIKSQNSHTLNHVLLQHISEEARHALFFKTLIRKIHPQSCPTFESQYLLAGEEAEEYFQSIDRQAEKDVSFNEHKLHGRDSNVDKTAAKYSTLGMINYLYTTWMIEERAVMVYQDYNTILQQHSFSFNLNFVLQEEDLHLKTVIHYLQTQDPNFKSRAKRLFRYEEQRFSNLIKIWKSCILQ